MTISRYFRLLLLGTPVVAAVLLSAQGIVQAQNADAAQIERGEYLFTDGYKCFACHGYDAQTGERRLVPLNYNLPGFTALVQNSPFPQMPSFNDVPAEDLAAIFAYIGTIPVDAPPLDDIDLLSDIARRREEAFEQ